MDFVSGYNATSTGGTVNTIALTTQSLYGASGAENATSTSTMTDATAITNIKAVEAAHSRRGLGHGRLDSDPDRDIRHGRFL